MKLTEWRLKRQIDQLSASTNNDLALRATTNYVDQKIDDIPPSDSLPDQTNNAGKFLKTDGSALSWDTAGGTFSGDMDDIADGQTYVKTENNFTDALVSKLGGIATGAEVNVQADWNQAGSTADDFIKNKPTIPTVSDTAYDATSWDNNTDAPTKNAVRDKFESLSTGSVPTAWGKYY